MAAADDDRFVQNGCMKTFQGISERSSPSRIPVKIVSFKSPLPAPYYDENISSNRNVTSRTLQPQPKRKKSAMKQLVKQKPSKLPKKSTIKLDDNQELPVPKSSSCAANFPTSFDPVKQAVVTRMDNLSTNTVRDKLLHLIPRLENWATNSLQDCDSSHPSNNSADVIISKDYVQTSSNDKRKAFEICTVPSSEHSSHHQPSYAFQGNNVSAKAIPLGMKEDEETEKGQIHACQTNKKPCHEEDRRISSFRVDPIESRDASRVSSINEPSIFWRADDKYGALIQRGSSYIRPKTFYSSTYEGMFYRKKAFSEGKGSVYLQPSKSSIKPPPYATTDAHFHAQHKTVLTKVFTETNYEYEDRDENDRRKRNTSVKKTGNASKNLPSKPILGKSISKRPAKVTIKDPPSSNCVKKVSLSSTRPNSFVKKVKVCTAKKHGRTDGNGKPSRVPRMILRGHGDPHLETPNLAAEADISDVSESNAAEVSKEREKSCGCEKCKVYKKLLQQSEATVKYLTQMLAVKDNELNNFSVKDSHQDSGTTDNIRKGSSLIKNPLLKKAEQNVEVEDVAVTSATSMEKPRATTATIPQFDLDEFIRIYFKHALLAKNFGTGSSSSSDNNNNASSEPFGPVQFFRVAISARDCMAQIVKHKLKHANIILKQKYDILASMKPSSSGGEPLDESVYFSVLDSYRRFTRYIYQYWRESLRKVETFELACVPQVQNRTFGESRKKNPMVYWHETHLTINGKRYSGTFIPNKKIVQSENQD